MDGTLQGVIVDQNYAAIPNVTLTLLDKSRARLRQITTGADGMFTFALLPPATYLLRANREGFSPVELEIVMAPPPIGSQRQAIRIQMQVGEIGASINVLSQGRAPEVRAPDSRPFMREFIERLPLNGLTLQPLIGLAPGIVLTRATMDEQGQFSATGQRANANSFVVDGVSANTGITAGFSLGQSGSGALPGLSATGGTNSLVSIEAVKEVTLQTGAFAVDIGRAPGALVSIVTRTGTRNFHGSFFDFFRHDALAANDWFANRDGIPKAALRQHNFGGSFSGPVLWSRNSGRDRTHFFFSYEGLRLLQPLFGMTAVPSLNARAEAPAAIKPLVDAYPQPNGEDLGGGLARFSAGYSDPTRLDAVGLRLDHIIHEGATLFARINYAPSRISQRSGSLSRVLDTEFEQRSLTVGATHALGTRGGNDLRVNVSFAAGRSFNRLDEFGGAISPVASAFFPAFATPQNAVTTIYVDGLLPLSLGKYADNVQRQFNLVDNVLFGADRHQLKFGLDYRRLAPGNRPARYDTAFNFLGVTGAEDFPAPTGTLLSATASSVQIAARDVVSLRFENFSAYGQDVWSITSGLQVTFGMRWEFAPPPVATNGQTLYTVGALANASTLEVRAGRLWRTDKGNLAPRFGVAWRIAHRADRETTLRAGFGVFFDGSAGLAAANAASFPYFRNKSLFAITGVPYPLNQSQAAPPPFSLDAPYGSMEVFDPRLRQPRTDHWNVSVDHQFDANHLVSVRYVGAAGRQLLRREAWVAVNSNFLAPLYITRNAATSDYEALQFQFQRRLTRGLQLLLSYSWAHSLDLASNDSTPLTPAERLRPRTDRGPSDFDVRHLLSAAMTYDLPAGTKWPRAFGFLRRWSTAALVRAQSSTPVNITYSRDIGFGFFPLRPDLVPGIPIFLSDPSAPGGRRLNTNPASVPGQASSQIGPYATTSEPRQGTLGRNAIRGLPFWQIDASLERQFSLSTRFKLHLRAEVFNLFNHPNFGNPGGVLTDPLFGTPTSMLNRGLGTAGINGGLNPVFQIGGPRSTQLLLKLSF